MELNGSLGKTFHMAENSVAGLNWERQDSSPGCTETDRSAGERSIGELTAPPLGQIVIAFDALHHQGNQLLQGASALAAGLQHLGVVGFLLGLVV